MTNHVVLLDIGDLLLFSETQGYNWNQFIAMLEKDRILPYYESPLCELYVGVGKDYGWSQEVSDVVDSFCVKHNGFITINLEG